MISLRYWCLLKYIEIIFEKNVPRIPNDMLVPYNTTQMPVPVVARNIHAAFWTMIGKERGRLHMTVRHPAMGDTARWRVLASILNPKPHLS